MKEWKLGWKGTLIRVMTVGGMALTGCGGFKSISPTPESTSTPDTLFVPSTLIPLTPMSSASDTLKATDDWLDHANQQSSFKPEVGSPFTEKIYDEVSRGTFLIEVTTVVTEGEKTYIKGTAGTAWLAKVENDPTAYYWITDAHVFRNGIDSNTNINLWRPGLDTQKYTPKKLNYAMGKVGELDIVVLRCEGEYPPSNYPLYYLPWRDKVSPSTDDQVLAVGFPQEFRGDSALSSHTLGEVIKVEGQINLLGFPPSNKYWYGLDPINSGSSGSPVVVVQENGEPIVIGMVVAGGDAVMPVKDIYEQMQPISAFQELKLQELLDQLR